MHLIRVLMSYLGFLPVIFTWLRARRQSVQLPEDSEGDPQASHKINLSQKEQLRGWKVLLLWLPTICDLTGTTVSAHIFILPKHLANGYAN